MPSLLSVLRGNKSPTAVFAAVIGTIMSMSYFLQAYKIFKRKRVDDISLPFFLIFFIGAMTWLLYGLSISNSALMYSNIIAVFGAGVVVLLYFRYANRKVKQ